MNVDKLKATLKGSSAGFVTSQTRIANFEFSKMSAITKKRYIFRGLLLGNSGSGKTHLAGTLPIKDDKPNLLVDFDLRGETLAGFDTVVTLTPNPFAISTAAIDVLTEATQWKVATKVLKWLNDIPRNEFPFSGIIFDGVTSLASFARQEGINKGGSKDWAGLPKSLNNSSGIFGRNMPYEEEKNAVEQYVAATLRLPCNIIWTGHLIAVYNTNTGLLSKTRKPMFSKEQTSLDAISQESGEEGVMNVGLSFLPFLTGALKAKLPAYFSEVWHLYKTKEGYQIRFTGSEAFDCFKSSLNTAGRYWDEVEKSAPLSAWIDKRFKDEVDEEKGVTEGKEESS